MQEQLNEKISMPIDDQLDSQQALALLKNLQKDPALRAKQARYQLIGQALKADQCVAPRSDFLDKIHYQLRDEPAYLLPRRKQPAVNWQKSGLAVAASVMVAAVLLFAKVEKQAQPLSVISAKGHVQQNVASDAHLKEYLQAHDKVWFASNSVGGQHYARLVGYKTK